MEKNVENRHNEPLLQELYDNYFKIACMSDKQLYEALTKQQDIEFGWNSKSAWHTHLETAAIERINPVPYPSA